MWRGEGRVSRDLGSKELRSEFSRFSFSPCISDWIQEKLATRKHQWETPGKKPAISSKRIRKGVTL
jgi:hypothetical protein